MLLGCKKLLLVFCCLFLIIGLLGFIPRKSVYDEEGWKWVQRLLLQAYDHSTDKSLKKWELSVTPEGFFRLKKYFISGKQEYYSFNLGRLKEISYMGAVAYGTIIFTTDKDDVIVQTYNDPAGNIDSMSTGLSLPVINLKPERIDSLKVVLSLFKR